MLAQGGGRASGEIGDETSQSMGSFCRGAAAFAIFDRENA